MKRFQDNTAGKHDLTEVPVNVVCIGTPTTEKLDATRDDRESGKVINYGADAIPAIGERVKINFNQLGTGIVESYFYEHGFLGVCVKLDVVPEWKRKQQKDNPRRMEVALVYGAEITVL